MPAQDPRLDGYTNVADRIKEFRSDHKMGSIVTTLLSHEPVSIHAAVWVDGQDRSDQPWGTGIAYAGGGMGHRADSAYEKTETAAIGRALAACGYGTEENYASRQELDNYEERNGQPVGGHMAEQAEEVKAEYDLDNNTEKPKPKTMNPANAGQPATAPQIKYIEGLAEKKGVPVPDLTNLTKGEANAIIEDLKA